MKVVIGTDSLHSPLTGVGRYTFELCKRLMKAPAINELSGFDFGRFHSLADRLDEVEQESTPGKEADVKSRLFNLRASLSRSRIATRVYQHYATTVCGLLLQRKSDALFHSPNFHLPRYTGKSVVTIHDLSYLLFPDYHPRARVEWMSKLVPVAVRNSSHVLCVSESTKADLVENFHLDPGKVSVSYLGAGDEFKVRSVESITSVMDSFGLTYNQYFLCVSTIEPRKNIEALISAYMRMSKATRMRFPLVLAGGFGWHCDQLKLSIERLHDEGVKHLGFVSQYVLPLLYNGARCLVYPSFYEGFGLPILEAQASGTPVIASRTSSIPEVASAKALLISPDNNDELSQAMIRAIEDEGWLDNCSKAGLEKAGEFSWDKCAEATIEVYKRVAQQEI